MTTTGPLVNEAVKYWTLDQHIWRRKGLRSMDPKQREGYLQLLVLGMHDSVVQAFLHFIEDRLRGRTPAMTPEQIEEMLSC